MRKPSSVEDQKKKIIDCFIENYPEVYSQIANIMNSTEIVPQATVSVIKEGTGGNNG